MVSHDFQHRGSAEAGNVKFSIEQCMGSAVMQLQEVRNWAGERGGQGVLTGYELYTDIDLDTAGCHTAGYSARENSHRKSTLVSFCLAQVWGSVHLLRHGDVSQDDLWSMLKEMEDVVINLRRRHHTSRIVIGSDLNVSLAPSLEGLTGSPFFIQMQTGIVSLA